MSSGRAPMLSIMQSHLSGKLPITGTGSACPGVTGLAQVLGGYADTERAIVRKARLDRFYVCKSRALLDLYIIWRTVLVMLNGYGAR